VRSFIEGFDFAEGQSGEADVVDLAGVEAGRA
jgi:hypothetical protein